MPMMNTRPSAIPFYINAGKLVPFFGDYFRTGATDGKLVLKPGESATLTYTGVLQIRSDGRNRLPSVVVEPIRARSTRSPSCGGSSPPSR